MYILNLEHKYGFTPRMNSIIATKNNFAYKLEIKLISLCINYAEYLYVTRKPGIWRT